LVCWLVSLTLVSTACTNPHIAYVDARDTHTESGPHTILDGNPYMIEPSSSPGIQGTLLEVIKRLEARVAEL
ncbi:MAG TPA: hypothetical protein VJU54_08045, partial [Nitrospiraceae bacterium]|nr:hypothetical protein [Nitrospiraceae bacterium]